MERPFVISSDESAGGIEQKQVIIEERF